MVGQGPPYASGGYDARGCSSEHRLAYGSGGLPVPYAA
jgi:hypothetical protein